MADISGIKLDVGSVLSGAGQFLKDVRTALTGKEPVSAEKAAEIVLKSQELETTIDTARIGVMVAEASSTDKWTSRARPSFMYVIYILILTALPMGIIHAVNPDVAANISKGFGLWLKAIPESLYALFGAGYLGYSVSRSYDKKNGVVQ